VAQVKRLKPIPLLMSPTKQLNPKLSNFQKIPARRLATSFERLNSSLAQLAGELWWCKVMANKWFTQVLGKSTWLLRC